MAKPLAYLLTWTCYGTWLHGDLRGSVDRRHKAPGEPLLPANPGQRRRVATQMIGPSQVLDAAARALVHRAITDHCEHRGWTLHTLSVRTNHVHVVVSGTDASPERVMVQLKAWSTRRLRAAGLLSPDARLWTKHGSTRYLWNEPSVAGAIRYVTEMQGASLT
ncbi:MAG: transposase [Pirellulales bacterium]